MCHPMLQIENALLVSASLKKTKDSQLGSSSHFFKDDPDMRSVVKIHRFLHEWFDHQKNVVNLPNTSRCYGIGFTWLSTVFRNQPCHDFPGPKPANRPSPCWETTRNPFHPHHQCQEQRHCLAWKNMAILGPEFRPNILEKSKGFDNIWTPYFEWFKVVQMTSKGRVQQTSGPNPKKLRNTATAPLWLVIPSVHSKSLWDVNGLTGFGITWFDRALRQMWTGGNSGKSLERCFSMWKSVSHVPNSYESWYVAVWPM